MNKNENLNLNIYEVKIDEETIKDASLIHNLLFDCPYALFLVDITSNDSFQIIKDLLYEIKDASYPFLKKILVLNKLDLNYERQVNFLEISDFLYQNKELELDNEEVSLRTEENMDKLLGKINKAVNIVKNQIPTNIIYETNLLNAVNKDLTQITTIVIGDSSVGKSCFINRYFKNRFTEQYISNIGFDKQMKIIKIDNTEYKLNIWDTAGQERFRSLPKKYYQNADGIFILFDVTNEESFKNVNYWLGSVKDYLGDNEQNLMTIFIVGNKIDLKNRVISRTDAENYANSLGIKYFEISAKINLNINEVIGRMILECHMNLSNVNDVFIKSTKGSINTQLSKESKKVENNNGGCCEGGNNKKNKVEKKDIKVNEPKMRESLETIKSAESQNISFDNQ